MKKYLIFGLKRSGNHAIIEWISDHFRHTEHLNDISRPKGPNSFREYGRLQEKVDCRVHSVEGCRPFSRPLKGPWFAKRIGILRDYYNTQASQIMFGRKYPWAAEEWRQTKSLWIDYAKAFLRFPESFILYNRWVAENEYLEEVESRYGWPRRPRKTDLPESGIGRGSSFDVGEPDLTRVRERWRSMSSRDIDWLDAVDNREARELNRQIFGWVVD